MPEISTALKNKLLHHLNLSQDKKDTQLSAKVHSPSGKPITPRETTLSEKVQQKLIKHFSKDEREEMKPESSPRPCKPK